MAFELNLHIGVHKTASTFLQRALSANADILSDAGISVPSHRETRRRVTNPCQSYAEFMRPMGGLNTTDFDAIKKEVKRYLDECSKPNTKVVLLSDENFVGHCGHVVRSAKLYGRRNVFLRLLSAVLPQAPHRVFVAVRSYAEFYASVYSQYLHEVTPERYVNPETFVHQILKRPPSWTHFIKSIRRGFPKCEIVLWRYEDMMENWMPVFEAFLGKEMAGKVIATEQLAEYARLRTSMSQRALDKFLASIRHESLVTAIDALPEIRRQAPTNDENLKLSLFSSSDRLILDRLYLRHIKQIKKNHPYVTFLKPSNM